MRGAATRLLFVVVLAAGLVGAAPAARAVSTALGLSAPGCIQTHRAPQAGSSSTSRSVTVGGVMIDTPWTSSGSRPSPAKKMPACAQPSNRSLNVANNSMNSTNSKNGQARVQTFSRAE